MIKFFEWLVYINKGQENLFNSGFDTREKKEEFYNKDTPEEDEKDDKDDE